MNNLAMAEALVLCQRSGVDPSTMLAAITEGAAGSWQLSNLGPRIVQRDFAPGFKVGLQQKDLRLALEAAGELRVPLVGTALVHQLFAAVDGAHGPDVRTPALGLTMEARPGVCGGAAPASVCGRAALCPEVGVAPRKPSRPRAAPPPHRRLPARRP